MNTHEVSARLLQRLGDLSDLGVGTLAVFGSVARDEATAASDVDLLVEFSRPVGLFEFVHLKSYLEQVLGCSVDLVTADALRPEMREQILREAIVVASGLDSAR
jgi:predicted nucleotidyltransferase